MDALSLEVQGAYPQDHFYSIARVDQNTMQSIGATEGDVIEITGRRTTVARCLLLESTDENKGIIRMTLVVRNNAEVVTGGSVK